MIKFSILLKSLFIVFIQFLSSDTFAQPVISSFTPENGPVGTTLSIAGSNFNAIASNNIVYFGAVQATVLAASSNTLSLTVPAGATFQPISILDITTKLTAYSSKPFILTFPNPFTGIPVNYYKPKVDFATDVTPQTVVISDLDGDGKPDLNTSNYNNPKTASLLRNTSAVGNITTSSFAPKVDVAAGGGPYFLAIGDLDGDGKPDLVIANYFENSLSVLKNISTSGSISVSSFATKVDFATGAGPYSLAIGDLDGDGKPDLVATNYGAGTISILKNTSASGILSFASKVDFTAGANPGFVAIGDLDGDTKRDIVVDNYPFGPFGTVSNTISVFRNVSSTGIITTSSFNPKVDFITGTDPKSVAIGDIDGDGKPDLVTSNYNTAGLAANHTVSVLRNTSTSGTINFASKIDFSTGLNPYTVAIGDLDGDAKLDLAVANYGANTFSALKNTSVIGTVNFNTKVDFTTNVGPQFIAIGDVDLDGVPEVTTANSNQNNISVLQRGTTVVPVSLLDFNVQKLNQNAVLVKWKTANEINADCFYVESSNDAVDFRTVGKVNAAGNTTSEKDYAFTHPNPLKGVNYYRLKQVDKNGYFIYTSVISIKFQNSIDLIQFYPNPTKDFLTIILPPEMKKEKMVVTIKDVSGAIVNQIVSQTTSSNMLKINLKRFSKGTYFIHLSINNFHKTEKIVLQ